MHLFEERMAEYEGKAAGYAWKSAERYTMLPTLSGESDRYFRETCAYQARAYMRDAMHASDMAGAYRAMLDGTKLGRGA